MDDEFQIKKPRDFSRINVKEMGELLWWSFHLGTYPEKLLSLTGKYGNLAEEVKKHLK